MYLLNEDPEHYQKVKNRARRIKRIKMERLMREDAEELQAVLSKMTMRERREWDYFQQAKSDWIHQSGVIRTPFGGFYGRGLVDLIPLQGEINAKAKRLNAHAFGDGDGSEPIRESISTSETRAFNPDEWHGGLLGELSSTVKTVLHLDDTSDGSCHWICRGGEIITKTASCPHFVGWWTCTNHLESITYTDGTSKCYCGRSKDE